MFDRLDVSASFSPFQAPPRPVVLLYQLAVIIELACADVIEKCLCNPTDQFVLTDLGLIHSVLSRCFGDSAVWHSGMTCGRCRYASTQDRDMFCWTHLVSYSQPCRHFSSGLRGHVELIAWLFV